MNTIERRTSRLGKSIGVAAFGVSRPLRRIPAIVSFLSPQPALGLSGGNRFSCPIAAIEQQLGGRVIALKRFVGRLR